MLSIDADGHRPTEAAGSGYEVGPLGPGGSTAGGLQWLSMAHAPSGGTARRTIRSTAVTLLALCLLMASCGGEETAEPSVSGSTAPPATADTDRPDRTTTPEPSNGQDGEPGSTATRPAQPLALRGDGLGIASFGEPADDVLVVLGQAIGSPPTDPWVEAEWIEFVGWRELGLYVGFDTPSSADFTGVRRFLGWEQVRPAGGQGLVTTEGIGVGATLAELRQAYSDRLDVAAEPDVCLDGWSIRIRSSTGETEMYAILEQAPADNVEISLLHAGPGVGC